MNILAHRTSKIAWGSYHNSWSQGLKLCHSPSLSSFPPSTLSSLASSSFCISFNTGFILSRSKYKLSLCWETWPRKQFHAHIVLAHDSNGRQTPCIHEIYDIMKIPQLLVLRSIMSSHMNEGLVHYWLGLGHSWLLQPGNILWLRISQEPKERG